jgi:hypothetical protein
MTPTAEQFERSVARWLRAYPRRWRVARGAEMTAVLADLAEPGARRVGARTAAGLVRAGWATRWREHPPLGTYLAYRLFERRLPVRYHPWVRDDIEARHSLRGDAVAVGVWALIVLGLPALAGAALQREPGFWVALTLLYAAVRLVTRRARRARTEQRHLVLLPGEPVTVGAFVDGVGPRRRVGARGGSQLALGLVAGAALGWSAAALAAPEALRFIPCTDTPACFEVVTMPLGQGELLWAEVVLVTALAVGLALVPLVRRRLRRLTTALPTQPNRQLVPVTAEHVVPVMTAGLLVGGEAWLEGAGLMPFLLAPTAGALALVALPGVVALALLARDLPAVAWSDLRTIAVHGHAPAVDQPVACPVPVVGPVPPGARLGVPRPSEHPWRPYPAVPLPGRAVLEVPESAEG